MHRIPLFFFPNEKEDLLLYSMLARQRLNRLGFRKIKNRKKEESREFVDELYFHHEVHHQKKKIVEFFNYETNISYA